MPGRVSVGITEIRVDETDGEVLIPISRDSDLTGTVRVLYLTTEDSATGGSDYKEIIGEVVFRPGETEKYIKVPVRNDALVEGDEGFSFQILEVIGGELEFPRTVRVVINDDEQPGGGGGGENGDGIYTIDAESTLKIFKPVAFQFLPGQPDTMIVASKTGLISIVQDGKVAASPFLDLRTVVNDIGDRGLYDVELDPNFPEQPYVYVYYTADPPEAAAAEAGSNAGLDGAGNRYAQLWRFTADASQGYLKAVPGSGVVLAGGAGDSASDISGGGAVDSTYDIDQPPSGVNPDGSYVDDYIVGDAISHAGGDIEFDPAGNLLLSIGDGGSFNFPDLRNIRVQDVDSLSGKVIRINRLTGEGVADNPYFDAADPDGNASKVYQMGLRNPYRIELTDDGRLIVADVGWGNYEEVNIGGAGANYGWPFYEGGDRVLVKTRVYMDTPEAQAFYDSGTVVTAPWRGFSHKESDPGFKLQAIIGGFIYNGDGYPAELRNDYFFTDIVTGDLYSFDITDPSRTVKLLGQIPTGVASFHEGPDGEIYYVGVFLGQIGRLAITEGNGGGGSEGFDVRVSRAAGLANHTDLQGTQVTEKVYLFLDGDTGNVRSVEYSIDGRAVPIVGDAGGPPNGTGARLLDTQALDQGLHILTTTIRMADGQVRVISDNFLVQNDATVARAINAGGVAFTTGAGTVYRNDANYYQSAPGSIFSTNAAIAGTEDDKLFQNERWATGDFGYRFALANGGYFVTLHFAELFYDTAGKRVFDVRLEGRLALDDLDVAAEVGGLTALSYTLPVLVTDGILNIDFLKGLGQAKINAIEVTEAPLFEGALVAVNSGDGVFTAGDGTSFAADAGYVGSPPASVYTVTAPIAGTTDDRLYQSERWATGDFGYRFEVGDGTYRVTLHFAELFHTAAGQRVFDVALEGQTRLQRLDVLATAGAKTALSYSFDVYVADGTLDIDFLKDIGSPKINGIEVHQTPALEPAVLGIDSGGAGGITADGAVFGADAGYFRSAPAAIHTTTAPIAGTIDDTLYQSERWSSQSFGYAFDLADGAYLVTLHFAEIFYTDPGERFFDVRLEGRLRLNDLDIVAKVGANTALSYTLPVLVTDGNLDIRFDKLIGNPKINAIEIVAAPITETPVLAVNAGGGFFSAADGTSFGSDRGFRDVSADSVFAIDAPITGTLDDALYQTERWAPQDFGYSFDLANGGYLVTLHFAELFHTSAGRRVFDVAVEGNLRLDDLDIVAEGGSKAALSYVLPVLVTDGTLDIDFLKGIGNPKINAIEITKAPIVETPVRAINAGGASVFSAAGTEFFDDQDFVFSRAGSVLSTEAAISGTLDDALYQDQRFANGNFGYDLDVGNGDFLVTLHFAELVYTDAGERLFDVGLEAVRRIDDLDIWAEVGANAAHSVRLGVEVTDGVLDIDFLADIATPVINGIEIARAGIWDGAVIA